MRVPFLAAVPVLAALSAAPAGAQVSARLHLDVPLGRRAPIVYGAPRRQVIVREYDASRFGPWDSYYDEWAPITLYYYDGYYYDYPIVEYAQPVVVYSYRNEFFFPPRDRRFELWRREFRFGGNFRGVRGYGRDGWDYRAIPRDGRDGRQFQSFPRDGRDGRDGRQYQSLPRDGRDGRRFQPAPRDGRDGRQFQPVPQGRGNGNGRDGRQQGDDHGNGRSRPRP